MSQAAFGREAGVSPQMVGKYLAGSTPGAEKVPAIARALGVDEGELLALIVGPVDDDNPSSDDTTLPEGVETLPGLSAPAPLVTGLQETVDLTLYTSVCAGEGALIFDEASRITVSIPPAIAFHFFGFHPPPVMGVSEVVGDSMIPMLEPGDLVLYDLTPDATGGGVFVVNYDGRAACKRVQPLGRSFRLIPENRAYRPEVIRTTDDGYIHSETGEIIEFGIVGKVLFPRPQTPRLHVQQVADLLRGMFRAAAAEAA